jgi:hypothetical protein
MSIEATLGCSRSDFCRTQIVRYLSTSSQLPDASDMLIIITSLPPQPSHHKTLLIITTPISLLSCQLFPRNALPLPHRIFMNLPYQPPHQTFKTPTLPLSQPFSVGTPAHRMVQECTVKTTHGMMTTASRCKKRTCQTHVSLPHGARSLCERTC